jgi:hypothetical protein
MRFDEVLARSDGPAVAADIAELRTPGRYVLEGLHQYAERRHWQFRLDVDESQERWTLDRSDGPTVWFRDGVLHDADGDSEDTFAHSTVAGAVVRMALPDQLLWWGRGPESFSPVLVQHIGERSVLVTFEHRADPAFRTTLVVDEHDGIARRRFELGELTHVFSARRADPDEVLPPARFEPLTDWIRPAY